MIATQLVPLLRSQPLSSFQQLAGCDDGAVGCFGASDCPCQSSLLRLFPGPFVAIDGDRPRGDAFGLVSRQGNVPKEATVNRDLARPAWHRWIGLTVLACAAAGCNSVDCPPLFRVDRWFHRTDPLVVLRDSNDGNKRAEAFRDMREPSRHGNPESQEVYLKVLTTAAKTDPEPMCRRAAIVTLGKYKDPRAVQCLEEVCQQNHTFTPEMNSLIRQEALAALQETGDPAARRMLLVVARGAESPLESSLSDRQQTLAERLAAVRGLGKFQQYDSIETLVHLMETERDPGLRECAYQSLRQATGKSLPPDAAQWRAMLRNPGDPALAGNPSFIQRVTGTR